MRVNIKTIFNENFTLDVDPEELMESVREKVQELIYKPNPLYCVGRIHLLTGRSVDYGRTVNCYIVNEGQVIHVIPRTYPESIPIIFEGEVII